MLTVLGRRLAGAIPVLLALVCVVFILQKVTPINPVAALVGQNASPAVYDAARHKLGLDQPVPVQLWHYIVNAVRGNLGQSTVTRTSVSADIKKFMPVTLELVFASLLLVAIIGTFLGLATAQKWRGSGVLRFILVSGASVPVFLGCLLGMIIFYRWLNILPVTGQTSFQNAPTGPTGFLSIDSLLAGRPDIFLDDLKHLILPAFCVAITPAVSVGRVLRSSLENTLRSDYTRTARAKGLGEKQILIKHALRNSAGPVLALMGLQTAGMIGNCIVVELIFARPGIGQFVAQAISAGDFNSIAGVTLVIGLFYVLSNVIVDALQSVADPRVSV